MVSMAQDAANKPTIRLLHQLGRSGGTVISKCLAVMDGTVLLSEVHPHNHEILQKKGRRNLQFMPLVQAQSWFGLVSNDDVLRFRRDGMPEGFLGEIGFIERQCTQRGLNLVLRDYNNLDFTGVNYYALPRHQFTTKNVLEPHYRLLRQRFAARDMSLSVRRGCQTL